VNLQETPIKSPAPEKAGQPEKTPSPYVRPKKTKASVLLADRLAKRLITIGGVSVIVAVMGILLFFLAEVAPLFGGGSVEVVNNYSKPVEGSSPSAMFWDEYRCIAVEVSPDGQIIAYHAETGEPISVEPLNFQDDIPTAFSAYPLQGKFAFGFNDGLVRSGRIEFTAQVLPWKAMPEGLKQLKDGDYTDGVAVYSKVPGDQIRKVVATAVVDPPVKAADGKVEALAIYAENDEKSSPSALAALDDQGNLALTSVTAKKNLMTGKIRTKARTIRLPSLPSAVESPRLLLSDAGKTVYVAALDGTINRYDARDPSSPFLAETSRVTAHGVKISSLSFLAGGQSLVVGGSDGTVNIYFLLHIENTNTVDEKKLVLAREFEPHESAVIAIVPEMQGKSFATADASGNLWLRHATSQQTLLKLRAPEPFAGALRAAALAPRLNGILSVDSRGSAGYWQISVPHPEASWKTFFGKIWYEGYPEPSYTWQSSAATDDFEKKLSLIPLIFGTMKATLYSMLFAVPIAIMAAIFTSEFLDSRYRGALKSGMEMMASLPSVVLGFVGALVLAPVVENWIGAVILAIFMIPLSLFSGAYLWQLLPRNIADRYRNTLRFALMWAALFAGFVLAYKAGPSFESAMFSGGFKKWLAKQAGNGGFPLLFLLFLPAAAASTLVFSARWGEGAIRRKMRGMADKWGGAGAGLLDFARVLLSVAAAIALASACASFFESLGFDPRKGLVGPYVQRNTLIVGFAMGFAVIPIIYTIAEDALSAVPKHLRSASLGCGATNWQTALWVVVPAAMSGIFSAVMVGMGRAVGETMIVVMAAGNTPILDLNIFNGLRALSANIAVELPEAVRGGTLYRTLFLSALVLFAMTFVINTIAELVRIKFRKRFQQL